MRQLVPVALSILIGALGCASPNAGFPHGENLVQPLPLPGSGWVLHRRVDGNTKQFRWLADDENGHADISIASGAGLEVAGYLAFDADLQRAECATAERAIITNAPANGYPSTTWFVRCGRDASERFTLQKAIQGADSFYLVKRIWPSLPTKADYTMWRDYFETVVVCDTGVPDSCPADFAPAY